MPPEEQPDSRASPKAPAHEEGCERQHCDAALTRSVVSLVAACLLMVSLDWLGQGLGPPVLALAVAYVFGWVAASVGLPLVWLAGRLPRWARVLACVTAGFALGVVAAQQTGAFVKLSGKYRSMAMALALGAPLLGALLCGWVAILSGVRLDRLGKRGRGAAVWAAVTSAAGGIACLALEQRTSVLRGYPSLLTSLFFVKLALFAAPAAMISTTILRSSKVRRIVLAGLAILFVPGLLWTARASPSEISRLLPRLSSARQVTLLRWMTDVDGDGHSSLFAGQDCAPFDPSVHPGRIEIPENGKDDNCLYGDAVPRKLAQLPAQATSPGVPMNVLLITVDSLRPDHTSVYGYPRRTTPRLEAFAAGARHYTHAYANGAWTGLSLPSLFTSALPRDMRWTVYAVTERGRLLPHPVVPGADASEKIVVYAPIPQALPWPPLPAWLSARGMKAVAIVPPELIEWMKAFFEGRLDVLGPRGKTDAGITDAAIASLADAADRPWFLWAHYYGVHAPIVAAQPAREPARTTADSYDAAIAAVDDEIGRLIAFADASSSPPAIIVTADHGEELEASGGFHGLDLRESCLHVPLLVRGPGFSPGVDESVVSLVDVMPTILRWTGSPAPPSAEGLPLDAVPEERIVVTDLWRYDFSGRVVFDATRARTRRRRLEVDLLLGRRSHTSIEDYDSSPPSPGEAALDLDAAIGAYLERAVGGP